MTLTLLKAAPQRSAEPGGVDVGAYSLRGRISVNATRSFQSGPASGDATYTPAPPSMLNGNGPNVVTLLTVRLIGIVHVSSGSGAFQFAVLSLWIVNVTPDGLVTARNGWKKPWLTATRERVLTVAYDHSWFQSTP